MSDTKKLQTFNVKKDKKRQAKKRKLEAFLNLVRQDEVASNIPGKKKSGGSFQENYKALKDELRKYQKTKVEPPSINLKDDGRCALINFSPKGEILKSASPLFLEDIHHLLLMSVLGNVSPFPLRWATLKSAQNIAKTVMIEIEGLSQQNVSEIHCELNKNNSLFPFVTEVVSSNKPFAADLSTMHLTTDNLEKKNYSSIFPMDEISTDDAESNKDSENNKCNLSKLHLLLSPIQLAMEHYPLPQSVFEQSKSDGYCFSKDAYTAVHEKSPMFAVDCEMCRTISGRQDVTRVAIVNENLETIYHTLIKPKEEIVDYITRYSGITEKMLRNVTTTLDDVQKEICEILPSDAILCGQSLNCDLHGLKMIHPYVIDTSIIFNEHGIRHKKTSLKQLARIHLKETIQDNKRGHNPIEDSIATMKLVQLKLKKGVEYGDAVLSENAAEDSINTTDNKEDNDVSGDNEKCTVSDSVKSNPDSGQNNSYVHENNVKMTNEIEPNSDAKANGFFSTLSKFSKKVCLIGCESSLNNYYEEMIADNVTKLVKSKSEKILKATADNVDNYDLILSHLVDTENCRKEIIDEIMQTYATFPCKTLFIIFISGVNNQSDEKFKHSFCMLTLKT